MKTLILWDYDRMHFAHPDTVVLKFRDSEAKTVRIAIPIADLKDKPHVVVIASLLGLEWKVEYAADQKSKEKEFDAQIRRDLAKLLARRGD